MHKYLCTYYVKEWVLCDYLCCLVQFTTDNWFPQVEPPGDIVNMLKSETRQLYRHYSTKFALKCRYIFEPTKLPMRREMSTGLKISDRSLRKWAEREISESNTKENGQKHYSPIIM